MEYAPGISQLAGLLADPGRAAMLWALMDGSARPAGELGLIAGLSASSTSGHLARLAEGGLLAVETHGRNRYYRLATAEIGVAIEALAAASDASRPPRRTVPASRTAPAQLRHARTCYDHLAGELAVDLFSRMSQARWLEPDRHQLSLSREGEQALTVLGVDIEAARRKRRRFACTCPDWSERKPHLGGALGAALLDAMLAHRWIERMPQSRALRVTPAGTQQLAQLAL